MKISDAPDPDAAAILYRSRAGSPAERKDADMEAIATGTLAGVARMALSDPDEDYWPYRITAGDRSYDGEGIRKLKPLVARRRR